MASGGKEFPLSIVIRAIDKATAPIRAINDRLKPLTASREAFGKESEKLGESLGLDQVTEGFSGLRSVIGDIVGKLLLVAGAAVAAGFALKGILDYYDNLGDAAQRIGISADALAQLRYAAERSGAPVEALDEGMLALNKTMGQLSAGTGRAKKFLDEVSPALERQLKAAHGNVEAFDLLASAMSKLGGDREKQDALAKAFGIGPELVPLLEQGSKGVQDLRDRYASLAGSQDDAANAGGKFDDSMKDLHAGLDRVKAAIAVNLGPALTDLTQKLTAFLGDHKEEIAAFIKDFGEKLPARIQIVIGAFQTAFGVLQSVWNTIGGIKGAAIALAAVIGGPLLISIGELGVALLTTPVGWFVGALGVIAGLAYLIYDNWGSIVDFFTGMWLEVKWDFLAFWDKWLKPFLLSIPGVQLIVDQWEPIKHFFAELWNVVTDIFKGAWDTIKAIVDDIIAAADKVVTAARKVKDFFVADDTTTVLGKTGRDQFFGNLGFGPGPAAQARVQVDFANAPPGTRVTSEPGAANLVTNVGYQLLGPS